MRRKKLSTGLFAGLAIFAASFLMAGTCTATDQEYILYLFQNYSKGGAMPRAGLILDASGNLYGTTSSGGDLKVCNDGGCGTVFELSPLKDGSLHETVLHTFGSGSDGAVPWANLVFDALGNLYGTTEEGGAYSGYGYGGGTVFELSPTSSGSWTETVLYNFSGTGSDGLAPEAGLVFDALGNLYGTTVEGGDYGFGTVFELSPLLGGGWSETTLHSFNLNGTDGVKPYAGLTFDAAGNLYGTTADGGDGTGCTYNCGIVFKLTPSEGGTWAETILHSFTGSGTGGYAPVSSGVIFDSIGNLYGTTSLGGTYGGGTAFELSPTKGGAWEVKWLHGFGGNYDDGWAPITGVIFDTYGNLYGTTVGAGTVGGTVFELSPATGGKWSEKVVHSFKASDDADEPTGLTLAPGGYIYGTSTYGGSGSSGSEGIVYEIRP